MSTLPVVIAVIVEAEDDGLRLDAYLAERPELPSRSFVARLVSDGRVRLNGAPARKSAVIAAGDLIEFELPPPAPTDIVAEDIPLDIRFEDDDVLVLSKPAGMVVHPAAGHSGGTLVNALLAHCDDLGLPGGTDRPGIVHRLDKDTSGLLIVAKNEHAQAALTKALADRTIERRYIALVHREVGPDTGLIDAPIGRDERDRLRMAVRSGAGSRLARTTFAILARWDAETGHDGFSLLECKLDTGRTHQIRVHLAYISHPVVGDPVYGRRGSAELGLNRQFLHAWSLAFDHPLTGERVVIRDPLPADLISAAEMLGPGRGARQDAAETLLRIGWVGSVTGYQGTG